MTREEMRRIPPPPGIGRCGICGVNWIGPGPNTTCTACAPGETWDGVQTEVVPLRTGCRGPMDEPDVGMFVLCESCFADADVEECYAHYAAHLKKWPVNSVTFSVLRKAIVKQKTCSRRRPTFLGPLVLSR